MNEFEEKKFLNPDGTPDTFIRPRQNNPQSDFPSEHTESTVPEAIDADSVNTNPTIPDTSVVPDTVQIPRTAVYNEPDNPLTFRHVAEPEPTNARSSQPEEPDTNPTSAIHSDDNTLQTNSHTYRTTAVPFKETVKPQSHKRYIFFAILASVVNLCILAGLFGVGYQMGLKHRPYHNTSDVISNLQKTPASTTENTPGAETAVAVDGELTTVEISKKVGPAVVGITSTVRSNTGIFGSPAYAEGTGSGIIISADGYIVTNNHVIEDASKISVTLNTGTEYEAELIGADSKTDLAVLKISPEEQLTVAELGDSSTLEVGERAVAIGNPLGMEFFGSTTQGIISAINRTITVEDTTMTVIQTDAAINQGNSGGALVNSRGQVIGINAVKISASTVEGMGFAIPISNAKPVIQDLIEHGYVKGRPVIGISSRDVDRYVASRQNWPTGIQIVAVSPGSGAEQAGLVRGDIVVKADGTRINNTSELNAIKDRHRAGDFIELEVYKIDTGVNKTVKVKLTEQRP